MNVTICYSSQSTPILDLRRTIPYILIFLTLSGSFFLSLLLPLGNGLAAVSRDFYYYYPDSSQNNLSQLKLEVDNFFRQSNYSVRFQPFSHFRDFDMQVSANKPAFLFVPNWYFEKYKDSLDLVPLLRPQQDGSNTYQKVLLTQKLSNITIDSLANHTLAMTGSGDLSPGALHSILPGYAGVESDHLNIIHTAKDADALFAVALGQVDTALVAKTTLAAIAKINSRITQNVKILGQSAPIALPILCYSNGIASDEEIGALRNVLLSDDGKHTQARLKTMFQFNGWTDVNH